MEFVLQLKDCIEDLLLAVVRVHENWQPNNSNQVGWEWLLRTGEVVSEKTNENILFTHGPFQKDFSWAHWSTLEHTIGKLRFESGSRIKDKIGQRNAQLLEEKVMPKILCQLFMDLATEPHCIDFPILIGLACSNLGSFSGHLMIKSLRLQFSIDRAECKPFYSKLLPVFCFCFHF